MHVRLRELNETDLPLLLAWAYIKEIWTYLPTSRQNENLTWEQHFKWWLERKNRRDWMIQVEDDTPGPRSVGVVHVDYHRRPPEVGLYIGEISLWGHGVGGSTLKKVIGRVIEENYRVISAVIHPKNRRSIRLFTSLGFEKAGPGREGQDEYILDLCATNRLESPVREFKIRNRLSGPTSAL